MPFSMHNRLANIGKEMPFSMPSRLTDMGMQKNFSMPSRLSSVGKTNGFFYGEDPVSLWGAGYGTAYDTTSYTRPPMHTALPPKPLLPTIDVDRPSYPNFDHSKYLRGTASLAKPQMIKMPKPTFGY